jgi:hypothetical protein
MKLLIRLPGADTSITASDRALVSAIGYIGYISEGKDWQWLLGELPLLQKNLCPLVE